jgi:hypothetical protein
MRPKVLLVLVLASSVTLFANPQQVQIVTRDVVSAGSGAAPGGLPMKVGTGVIFGQVTEADSNRPVPGAVVSLLLPGAQALRVMADSQGRFGFRQLPPGAFTVSATRPGWVDGAFGRTRPGGPSLPVQLAEGDRAPNVVVPMWRYATIAGTVIDETGDPVVGATVRVLKRSLLGGRTSLKEVQQETTDDRGMYRVSQLEPGDYVVAVPLVQPTSEIPFAAVQAGRDVVVTRAMALTPPGGGGNMMFIADSGSAGPSAGIGEDGRPLAFATMFFPNAPTSTQAQVLAIGSGEERGSVDFQLHPVPSSTVSGTATGPDGAVPNLQVTLVPSAASDTATSIETFTGFSDQQGRFTVEGVPPGQYVLRAMRVPRVAMPGTVFTARIAQGGAVSVTRSVTASGPPPPLPTDATLWAELNLSVGMKDLTDVPVNLREGVKITGSVRFNGSAVPPAPEDLGGAIGIVLEPADARAGLSNAAGRVESSGQFATVGVPPGRYFVRIRSGLSGWTLQAVLANGRDASVVPVDISDDLGGVQIVFTDRPSELSGQVTWEGSSPEGATVLVFPADSSAWVGYGSQSRRLSSARVDQQGHFKVTALPAGDYLAVAIPDKMANDWQDPKFLESLVPDATRVHVGDGEKATASLKVAR